MVPDLYAISSVVVGCRMVSVASRKQVHVMNTPYTPLLYSKTEVYRGILFSYFCSKT